MINSGITSIRLPPMQRRFCNYLFQGVPPSEAAWRAYECSTRNAARALACRNLRNPKIRRYVDQQLLEHGMPGAAFQVLEEALGAQFVFDGDFKVPGHDLRIRAASLIVELPKYWSFE